MEFTREFIEIGQVQIRYYDIIIVFAMLIATFVAANLTKRSGRDPEHIYGALTWAIIPGIIFARLWYVVFPPQFSVEQGFDTAYYFENFLDLNNGAIAIWSGGLSIFGAILGGLLGTYIYLRRNKLPVGVWLDIAAIVLPLGQAIGRWANFINQELYGLPTGVQWWGLDIPIEIRPEQYRIIEYFDAKFHPLFLYESLWSLGAFFILLYLWNRQRDRFRPGDFFLLYVAQYSFIRFLLEFIRIEVTLINDINLAQAVTAVTFVLSVAAFLYRHRSPVEGTYPAPTEPELEQTRLDREQARRDARKATREQRKAQQDSETPTPAMATAASGAASGATTVTETSAVAASEAEQSVSGGEDDAPEENTTPESEADKTN